MIRTEVKALIRALTPTCRAALESAVGRCVDARHYEVTIELFLLGLLADRRSDFSLLVALHGFDRGAVEGALQRACKEFRTGNMGRPIFSPLLLQLFDDALYDVTVAGGRIGIRSGDAFEALARDPSRYGAGSLLDRFRELPSRDVLAPVPLGDLAHEARESPSVSGEAPVPRPGSRPPAPAPAPSPGADVVPIRRPAAGSEPKPAATGPSEPGHDLIALLSRRAQVDEADVAKVVAAWTEALHEALAPGGPGALAWPGVGTFERIRAHVGRTRERLDPFTRQTVVVLEGATFARPGFTPAPALARAVEPSLLPAGALDGLFDLPWETVEHARGPAVDVPHHLYLATSPDGEARATALRSLADELYCQGKVFEATGGAVPFLVRIASAPELPERAGIVDLLARVCEASRPEPPPAWWGELRGVLHGARAQVERLAAEDPALAEGARRFLDALGPAEGCRN